MDFAAGTVLEPMGTPYPSRQFGPTGIRIYPNGLPTAVNQYAWQGPVGPGGVPLGFDMALPIFPFVDETKGGAACQVTVAGDLTQLYQQIQSIPNNNTTKGGNLGGAIAFLSQRMHEILPSVTQENINKIIGDMHNEKSTTQPPIGVPLNLGSIYYIYYSPNSPQANNGPGLTIDTVGPKYINSQSASARQPDGQKHQIQGSYSILQGMANPYFSYGIHDRLFTTWGSQFAGGDDMTGDITATDSAYFQPASGAYGLLGVVKFTETSQGSANLAFNNRN